MGFRSARTRARVAEQGGGPPRPPGTTFVDLHCHWVAGIDDGARTAEEGFAMLRALGELGFGRVLATPHMRPGQFDNDRASLERAYSAMLAGPMPGRPEVALASEHFFDDVVFARILNDEALPYPGRKALLVEFPTTAFPTCAAERLFDLRRRGLVPVLAHPERYQPVWKDPQVLEPIVSGGTALLLDAAALIGKYGRAPQRAAERLLQEGWYDAACSDAHRPGDVADVARGIDRIRELLGSEELRHLLTDGPESILAGTLET